MEIKKEIYISEKTNNKVQQFLSAKKEEDYQGADLMISLPVDMEHDGIVMDIRCCGCNDEASYAEIVLFSHGCEVHCCAVPDAAQFCGTWSTDYLGTTYTVVVKKSTLHFKKGNLLDVKTGIIGHQVNCRHVMGGGLALQLRKAYPTHYHDYMADFPHLGGLCMSKVSHSLYVVGIYGQDGFGKNKVQTDYEALRTGLMALNSIAIMKKLPVYLPYKLGCGLAGGDWRTVLRIIEETVPGCTILNPSDD